MVEFASNSDTETISLGKAFGRALKPNSVVCFFGDLGAGKTTFIKGLAFGAAEYSQDLVNSPTFAYLNIYPGTQTIYHFDLYRLQTADDFLSMGFDEALFAGGICCIEWSERITSLLPEDVIRVEMTYTSERQRRIIIEPWNNDDEIHI